MKYNDLHICSFFSVTDCDQNYMQVINLKKLLGCWPFQIIQNFRNSSRSCAIFIFNKTCRSSLRTLNRGTQREYSLKNGKVSPWLLFLMSCISFLVASYFPKILMRVFSSSDSSPSERQISRVVSRDL